MPLLLVLCVAGDYVLFDMHGTCFHFVMFVFLFCLAMEYPHDMSGFASLRLNGARLRPYAHDSMDGVDGVFVILGVSASMTWR